MEQNNSLKIDRHIIIKKVISSRSIHAIGYDDTSQVLYVHFYKTGWFRYSNVSEGEYQTISNDPSIGTALSILLKGHLYRSLSAVEPEFKRLKYV